MIKGIIFDFDGVLVDSERVNIEAAAKTFSDLGVPLTEEEMRSIPGTSSQDFIPRFMRQRGVEDQNRHHEIFEINRKNYRALWPNIVTLFPDERETVDALVAQGKALAIATTNRLEVIEMFFERFALREKFSVVVTGENVTKRKPDPEVYELAIRRLNIPKEDLIAVEDTAIGLKSAKLAGLRCVAFPNQYTRDEDFSAADWQVTSFRDILSL